MHCTDVEALCRSCMELYRDQCVYRKVWSPSVAGGWVGLPLGLLLLHGAATGPATGNFYLLSSVKILATGQSLSTQHPHHRRSRQDQCVGRRGWDCEACHRGHVGTVATAGKHCGFNIQLYVGSCGHCPPPIPGWLLLLHNQMLTTK